MAYARSFLPTFRKPWLVAGLLLLGMASYAVLLYWELFFPQIQFDEFAEIGPFQVFSDQVPDTSLVADLEMAETCLKATPLYDGRRKHCIFVCHDPELYAQFSHQMGKPGSTQGFHLHPLGYTFLNRPFIMEMNERARPWDRHHLLEGNLAHVLVHEVVHGQLSRELGYRKARKLPAWKVEGYCEYAASLVARREDASYDWKMEVKRHQQGAYDQVAPGRLLYLRGQLMMGYLLKERGMSLQTAMESPLDEETCWEEVLAFVQSQ